jgi:hypothetical protein
MSAPARKRALSLTVLLITLALSGCGGGGHAKSTSAVDASAANGGAEHTVNMYPVVALPRGEEQATVLRVGTKTIPRSTVVHWTEVLTPKLASYEPKSRADCSALRAASEVILPRKQAAKLSSTQMQALCVRQQQAVVKETVLQQLLSYEWVIGEAEELGLAPSEAEAQQHIATEERTYKAGKVAFHHLIYALGRTPADVRLQVRLTIATERILELLKQRSEKKLDQAQIARYYRAHEKSFSTAGQSKSLAQVEQAVRAKLAEALLVKDQTSFVRSFRLKWLARTSCAPGYVVSRCRQWRGPSVLVSENAFDLR